MFNLDRVLNDVSSKNDALEHLFRQVHHFEGLFLMIINFICIFWQESDSASHLFLILFQAVEGIVCFVRCWKGATSVCLSLLKEVLVAY